MTFEQWKEELKIKAVETGYCVDESVSLDCDAFLPYFEDGLTPEQAIHEDWSYA